MESLVYLSSLITSTWNCAHQSATIPTFHALLVGMQPLRRPQWAVLWLIQSSLLQSIENYIIRRAKVPTHHLLAAHFHQKNWLTMLRHCRHPSWFSRFFFFLSDFCLFFFFLLSFVCMCLQTLKMFLKLPPCQLITHFTLWNYKRNSIKIYYRPTIADTYFQFTGV